jgi:hypothetical protein
VISLPLGNEAERTPSRYLMKLHQTLLATLLLVPMATLHAVEPASVQLTGKKCIRVNGRPFFPIGIYSASTADFPSLAEAGFNVVHRSREVTDTFPYCFPAPAPIQCRKLRVRELP